MINRLADGVFLCKNHLMTAIGDSGYGEIALTPDHLVDFSSGAAAIKVDVSTQQFNSSDFVEVWVTPFAENMTLPFMCCDPDLQGPPNHALRFSFNASGIEGTHAGDVVRYDNFAGSSIPRARSDSLSNLVPPSGSVRTTYEIDLSQNHVRFGLPTVAGGMWWTNTDISPLGFTQGIVQITHHSYNPTKHDPGTGVDTWHWSNFSIDNTVPFTIINGAERSVHAGGATTVHFPTPAPANSHLRFSGIGPQGSTYEVSYDGGASWVSPTLQAQRGTHAEHFSTYWTGIPAGVQTVMFRGKNWWGGPWWVRDPSIWSLTYASAGRGGSTPPPTAPPTASPQIPLNGTPCTVTINGSSHSGTCTGTFQPN
jgi:hypothetical protein